VRQGKALYAGVSNYEDPHFTRALELTRRHRWAPITIHQPRYHLFERGVERTVLPTAGRDGVGVIVFSPLAQGILTDRYLDGIPAGSRAASDPGNGGIGPSAVTPATVAKVRALSAIAQWRGQTMAQFALSWLLRDARVTSVLIGASSPEQVDQNVACVSNLAFADGELAEIDRICLGAA
jgi:L-glyceraldehyde 3-phosphate reductase